jgi:ABC-2 type transport system permease protein
VRALTGVRALLPVALRQNVRGIGPWVAGVTALSASSILAYDLIFPDPADRAQLAKTLGGNPALALIFGPARDLSTADGFNAWRAGMLGAFFTALMAIFTVVRNSRADEDSGQAELLASGVMTRAARLALAVLIASLASLAVGVVSFLVTVACGGGVTSTLILAATFTASGLMFAGVAAVTAQVASDAGTATSLAVATAGVCFVVRGYVDTSDTADWASWLSPFGWLELTKPASGNDPWPLLAALAFAVLATLLAFALQARRDFGQGLISPGRGPARAGRTGSLTGLAVRLNRGSMLAWLIAFVALGLVLGSLVTSVSGELADNPVFAQLAAASGGSSLVFGFLVTILQIAGLIAAVFGVQVVMRIYTEEVEYRVEPLLAGAVKRSAYLASNAGVAFLAPSLAYLIGGTAIAAVAGTDDTVSFPDVVAQTLVTLPAVWVLIALALTAVGARPALRAIGWLGIVASFGLTLLGPTFKLPDWALGISPLHHVPDVTADSPGWLALGVLVAIAAALTFAGFAGFRRREVL